MQYGGGMHHGGGGHQGGGHGGRHPSPSPQWFWGGSSSSSNANSGCKKAMKQHCKNKSGRSCMECAKKNHDKLIHKCPGGAQTMRKACQKDNTVVVHGLR